MVQPFHEVLLPQPFFMPSHIRLPRVQARRVPFFLPAVLLTLSSFPAVVAQPTVKVGGLAYLDYGYVVSSPDADAEGSNTFDYRRIYFTTDFTLSDQFGGRLRLEAQGTSTTAQGRPAPFVKDAYLTWQDPIGDNSRLRFGVQPPPLFELAEDTWGYRSLEKTIIDRVKANDSRDLGFRADVPIASNGAIRISGMFANGNGVRPEADAVNGKHVYGQIQALPGEVLRISAGTDYERVDGEDDTRHGSLKTSVFVGALSEAFHGGVEAYYIRTTFDGGPLADPPPSAAEGVGVSAFGAVNISDRTSVVGRYDFVDANAGSVGVDEHFGLAAFVFRPNPNVELMPNVVISKLENVEAEVTGRFTVHVKF